MTQVQASELSVRDDFPLLRARTGIDRLVYLDNAATSQKPQVVLDAIVDFYTNSNANTGRGYHKLGMAATDAFEHARAVMAGFVGAEFHEEIIFTSGTTDATNLVAETIGKRLVGTGDQVVVTGMEHNSNLLPWRRLCENAGAELVVVPIRPDGRVAVEDFAAALGPSTRFVALSHVSNVVGTVNPVRELVALAHEHGALALVDGAQAVPHLPVDVRDLDADFYCFSGHKMYGPMGIGVLFAKRYLLADLDPVKVGGGTVKGVSLTEPVSYVPAPFRFEAGTPHVAGAVGLAAAVEYLTGLGWDRVATHDALLVDATIAAVAELPDVTVIGDPGATPCGIVSVAVAGIHPYDVGAHLDAHGIAVRCGVHCASTFLDSLGLVGTVRLAFGVYNTVEEIDYVKTVLATVRPDFWTTEHPTTRFL